MSESQLDLRQTFRAVIEAAGETGVSHAFIGALPVLAWGRVRAIRISISSYSRATTDRG